MSPAIYISAEAIFTGRGVIRNGMIITFLLRRVSLCFSCYFLNPQILMRQDLFRFQLGFREQSWLISRSWVRFSLDVQLPLIAIELTMTSHAIYISAEAIFATVFTGRGSLEMA